MDESKTPTARRLEVTATIFGLVGRVGLFLLGMALLTDGLKFFAGDALRRGRVFGEAISMEEVGIMLDVGGYARDRL